MKVAALAKVLRRGNIWCLNAGENYKVKLATWWEFVKEIESTNVTVRENNCVKSLFAVSYTHLTLPTILLV